MAVEKPYKKSNYVSFNITKIRDYIRDVDRDLSAITAYLNTFPPVYQQSAEPTLASDSVGFWKDTDDSMYYLILNISGTQKKVQLT